jgi:SAM-dependent methyltransferase
MIKKIYKKEQFNPGIIGLIINPFYLARRGLYRSIKELGGYIVGKTLDVGCGKKPYEKLFNSSKYVGMDIENPGHSHVGENIDVYYDGGTFPFKKSEFDSVVTNQVLEHVLKPESFIREIKRVLKKGGYLLLTVPFVWDEHEKPNDYRRYTSFGIRDLLENNGFKIVKFHNSTCGIRAAIQLINELIYKKMTFRSKIVSIFFSTLLTIPLNVIGLLFPEDKNSDLYLDNIVLAKK